MSTKSTSKKTQSKVKKDKPKKYKIYCKIDEPPKGYIRGSMNECYDAKQVMYYGVKKIDSRILKSHENKINDQNLPIKKAGLLGQLNKLEKEFAKAKTKEEKIIIKEKHNTIKNELKIILEKIKTIGK